MRALGLWLAWHGRNGRSDDQYPSRSFYGEASFSTSRVGKIGVHCLASNFRAEVKTGCLRGSRSSTVVKDLAVPHALPVIFIPYTSLPPWFRHLILSGQLGAWVEVKDGVASVGRLADE